MGHDDREQNFERALTWHLRAPGDNGAADEHVTGCPDAEMLAAFHERMLSSQEMNATKEHVVGCSRCQEILALLETTDDIEVRNEQEKVFAMRTPVPVSGAGSNVEATPDANVARALGRVKEPQDISRGRRPATWRWVAPAGAIAASLLVWVVARESKYRQVEPVQNVQIAQEQGKNAELANRGSALAPSPAPPLNQSTDQLQANESSSTQIEQTFSASPLTRHVQGTTGGQAARNNRHGAVAGGPTGLVGGAVTQHSAAERTGNESAAGSPANEANGGDRKKTQSVTATNEAAKTPDSSPANDDSVAATGRDSGQNVVGREISQPRAANAPRAQEGASQQAVAPPSAPTASSPSASSETAHRQANHPNGDTFSASTETVDIGKRLKRDSAVTNVSNKNARIILVPGGTVEWRLGAPSIIERSVDGGLTWTRQNSGSSAELLAGAAPNEMVSWIVGRNGTILRTTDGGGHWSKVVSPITGDIGGIAADDAMHVVVVATGGNPARFATNDGGVTWIRTNK